MSLFSRNEARREKEQQPQAKNPLKTADREMRDVASSAERPVADSRIEASAAEALARHERQQREDQLRLEREARRAAERTAMPHEQEKPQDPKVEDAVVKSERSAAGDMPVVHNDGRQPTPLFSAETARDFRLRWNATQIGFVDDPHLAVKQADELVALMMQSLAKSFAEERAQLEPQMSETASTENLRVALQRYRSFYQRLLTL